MSSSGQRRADRCWVVGNGPSLRGFDFRRLNGESVLGMNAAYRYWQEINWYPTYYCCLDDELVATHWRQIIDLVRSGKVKKAFVSGIIYQYDSSIAADDRFVSFDQFAVHWHILRGKALGVPFIDSPYFRSSQDSKVTTGSHSIRFAAHLGYKNISLLGIDLKYVEKIPEAEQVGGIALRIRETPKNNPNYFFDGYQQAGDRYNIPNPSEHDGDLHFASLRAVRDDFVRTPTAPRVINCNSQSRLFEERVFPYLHVDRALNDRPLSSVVVPTTLRERDALLNQLWLWEQKDFAPEPCGGFLKPALTYAFNSGDSRQLEEEIGIQFEASSRLKEAFEAPTFMNIGLSGEQDQYIRDYSRPAGRFGYKAGPNNQFFETLARHASSTHYLFLMESDCLPIRAGWLNQLQTQLSHAEPFWILGSGYRGRTTLGDAYKRHINGNAVYAAGDVVFQQFIESFWRPELERIIQGNPRIAYDCALEILMGEAASDEPDNPTWRLTQELLHLIRCTDMIHNRSGGRDSWDTPPDLPAQLCRENPLAYFLHGKPFADGLANMRKIGVANIQKWKVPRDESFTIPGSSVIRAPSIVQSDEFPRILVFDHTSIGDKSATGELKASLFKDWQKSQYIQVHGGSSDIVGLSSLSGNTVVNLALYDQRVWLKNKIDDFKPEMIIYRPAPDTMPLHDFAMEVINAYDVPLVSWIMDDWPKALEGRDKLQFEKLERHWRLLLRQSAGAMTIGESMSRAFGKRYGVSFQAFANGIDPSHWPSHAPKRERTGQLVRYAGSLSPTKGLDSIVLVAQAIEKLAQDGVDIRFEIKVRKHCLNSAGMRFEGLSRTAITTSELSAEEYRSWLSDADVVLIAYNFDEASKDYIRYSIANKLPECLASGAVLLAIGPPDIATMQLLNTLDCSVTVHSPDAGDVFAALRDISGAAEKREELVARAKKAALKHFDIHDVRRQFMEWIRNTLSASNVSLPLKIARNAERRRWQLNHANSSNGTPAAKTPIVSTPPPAAPSHVQNPSSQAPLGVIARPPSTNLPKILLFDLTRVGEATATGELKGSLFRDWPKDHILQIFGGGQPTLGTYANGEIGKADISAPQLRDQLNARIAAFAPDLVVYRPVPDTPHLHGLAMEVIGFQNVPLVTWIMDDWPAALKLRDAPQFEVLDRDLRALFQKSVGALSIGTAMSSAFSKRYGLEFEPIANGIERIDWDWSTLRAPSDEVLIRYSGSLARDMGLESLLGVAEAVEALGDEGMNVTFEIKTRKFWADQAGGRFKGFSRTRVSTEELSAADYRKWLSGADIALICYNFDDASKAYVRYSVANKLPECLASGAALLAIGPPDIATMELLRPLDCSVQVETPNPAALKRALWALVGSRDKREALAQRAQKVALDRFDMQSTRSRFVRWLTNAAQEGILGKTARSTKRFEQDLQHLQARSQGKVSQVDSGIRTGGVHADTSEQLEQLSKKFDGIALSLRSQFTQNAS